MYKRILRRLYTEIEKKLLKSIDNTENSGFFLVSITFLVALKVLLVKY